jgi:hypothetical protein
MKISTLPLTLSLALVVVASLCTSAEAQLFGKRTVGGSFQPRVGPGASRTDTSVEDAGNIQGSERFLRENRSGRDFVGSDRREQQGFVGSQQALGTGRVRAATEGLETAEDPTARINPPLAPLRPKAMYYPKLVLDTLTFSPLKTSTENLPSPSTATNRVPSYSVIGDSTRNAKSNNKNDYRITTEQRLANWSDGTVKMTREGERVVLRGRVASKSQAEKIEILLSLEPGIYSIDNRLEYPQ